MTFKDVRALVMAALSAAALTALPAFVGAAPARADPDLTCVSGLVWRAARPGDAVCVTPNDRDRTAGENAAAASNVDPHGAYGPQSCRSGLVWRQAFNGDAVCVSPDTRRENLDWNAYRCGTVAGLKEHTGYCGPWPPPPHDLG